MPVNDRTPLLLQCRDASGRGLAVEFFKQGDRYVHRILAIDERGATPLLESIEGDDQTAWPPSPPLQEVMRQGDAILGVGMAGKSHWSLSVEIATNGRGLVFDAACRAAGRPARMGNGYRCAQQIDLHEKARSALLGEGNDAVHVVVQDVGENDAARITSTGQQLCIEPMPIDGATTVRWRYRLELV